MKINSKSMKQMNIRMIMKHLVEKGPTTRVDLSKFTKLTPSTITRMISDLSESGLVEESGQSKKSHIGRKAINLSITKKISSIVFNVDVERTTVAIGYLDKSIKEIESFQTGSIQNFISKVENKIEKIENNYPLDLNITSVIFAFPGIVDVDNTTIVYAPNLNWRGVKLCEMIKYPYRIIADNEANLSILAESVFSEDVRESNNAFFLYISQGIGGGAMINHQILRGKGFAGAEIGHTVVEARSEIKCHCGNYGCLERYASLILPVVEYEKNGRKLIGKTYTEKFSSLVTLYANGDILAKTSLEEFLHYISIGLINIVNTFNPEVIVIGGGFNEIWKYFGKELYKRVSERAMPGVLNGVIFRDTIFDKVEAPVAGGNVLAIENIINNLNI